MSNENNTKEIYGKYIIRASLENIQEKPKFISAEKNQKFFDAIDLMNILANIQKATVHKNIKESIKNCLRNLLRNTRKLFVQMEGKLSVSWMKLRINKIFLSSLLAHNQVFNNSF